MTSGKKTKIVATIGPTSDSPAIIKKLCLAGVNAFRFNMKHATIDWHNERIERVQKVSDELGWPVGIMVDLHGAEIRIEAKENLPVKKQDKVIITNSYKPKTSPLYVTNPKFFEALAAGETFLIDDGSIKLRVSNKRKGKITAQALNSGVIKHRKGINIPGKSISLLSLIKNDLQSLDLAAKRDVDFVALSYIRSENDLQVLKDELRKRKLDAQIVAKIETPQALENLRAIIQTADAILIARGDLGIEVPLEELTFWQKRIITQTRQAKKTVITATQMLQSMINNPRPTRAEATDVANAVYDGTDAVMLSAETAIGKFPVEAVEAMAKIAQYNDKQNIAVELKPYLQHRTDLVVDAAVTMIKNQYQPLINAALVFTESGYTARVLASYRPPTPVIAVTNNKKTVETLTLTYGVTPIYVPYSLDGFHISDKVWQALKTKKLVHSNQILLVIYGLHRKKTGLTHTIGLFTVK